MKQKTMFVCQQCGYKTFRWLGKCPDCNNWNSFVEEVEQDLSSISQVSFSVQSPVKISEIDIDQDERLNTGIIEFDRVLGGGIVQGSVVLINKLISS